MVAMDQRESLRTMLREAGHSADDTAMETFKLNVAEVLAPLASAFLIDRHHAYRRLISDRPLPAGCGLILAADALSQPPGEPVHETAQDEEVDPVRARRDGVVALKLLVIWKRDGAEERRVAMAHRFVEACNRAGLLSIVEGVAVAAPGDPEFDLDASILDAAGALGATAPSLYKAQVPRRGRGDLAGLVTACEKLDRRLDRPWVVLSNGVDAADFPTAVEAACRAGASGMLAGRALWRDALAAPDPAAALRAESTARMRRLVDIVDRHARRWNGVV
jgi:sulfofructosephosphate aldolase